MKVLRLSGLTFLVVALATMISFPGRPASGQGFPAVPKPPEGVFTQAPNNPYYPPSHAWASVYQVSGNDPEMLKLVNEEAKSEREAALLIKEYARTDNEGGREKLKTKLADVLGKEFDLQQKRRDLDLARLEAKVKKLRDLMKKRTDARQTIVDKRLDQLIREAEGLGWTVPPGPGLPRATEFVPPAAVPLR